MKAVSYTIVVLFFIWGCKSNLSDTTTISLDFSIEPTNIHEIGLINDVEIFHLDYKKALFGEVDKIIRHKDRIYLLDIRQTKSVIVYDSLGQFMNVISTYGQGPDDYLQLFDIFIDTDDETLNLVSRIDRKILKYDLNGEQLIGVIKVPKSFGSISKMKEGFVGAMRNWSEDRSKPYNVWTMSKDFNLDNYFFEIDPTWESTTLGGGSVFSAYQSNTYYITPMDYNIYRVENDKISIAYSFDLGSQSWPTEYREYEPRRQYLNSNIAPPYIDRFRNFQETANHLIVEVVYRGQRLLGVYNKQHDRTHIVKLDAYIGKYFFGFEQIVGFDENTIYSVVEASRIKDILEGRNFDFESKYPEQIKNLRDKIGHVDEEDNPYLVMYYLN